MVVGSPALNQNAFAVLAFAGLGKSDVKLVEFSSYGAMWKGILNNEVDAAIASTISGQAKEAESLAARPALPADARRRQGGLGAPERDRPVLRAAQGDLRRRRLGAEPGRAAELPVPDLHRLRLAAGRRGLRHRQVDDRQLRRLQGRRAGRGGPGTQAPEPRLGAAVPRGRGEGVQGSGRLEARARGAQPEGAQAPGDAGRGVEPRSSRPTRPRTATPSARRG